MSTEPEQTGRDDDTLEHDRGLPVHRSQEHPGDIPAFLDRALALARDLLPEVEDFTVDGVAFETAAGVWLAPIGVFDPTADASPTPEQVAAGEGDVAVWGHRMIDWANRAQHAMRTSWGAPAVHTPRRVGAAREPEGILDYLLLAQDFAQAEVWDRNQVFVALLTEWTGEPGASMLRQVAMLLPRPLMMAGMAAYLADETVQELLMHGESPVELHRRAWIMSTLFDRGEVRVRDVPIEATRCTLRSRTGTTSTWIFADDGRQLLLVHDPASEFLTLLRRRDDEHADSDDALPASGVPNDPDLDPGPGPGPDPDEAAWTATQLALLERLLDGVPADLRACVAARGETVTGDVAEHALAFDLLDGRPIPIVSGAFWFDGSLWRASPGLVQAGFQNGLTLDDFGLEGAVRTPFRLGGAFTPAAFTSRDEPAPIVHEVFDACPYPEQPRPEGDAVLGYGVPRPHDQEAVVEAIESACAAWWDRDPEQGTLGEDPFVVVGRRLRDAGGPDTLQTVLARGEYWTVEALSAWETGLRGAMTARWGEPTETVYDPNQLGLDHHTPLTAVMRGMGLTKGSLWWVDGHAVVTLAGFPRTGDRTTPVVVLVLCRADAVVELFGRMSIWELRWRARVIESLAALAHGDPEVSSGALEDVATEVAWPASAPATPLEGSEIQPTVRRIRIRAEDAVWTLHLTHDRRGVLTAHRQGASPGAAAAALLEGLPSDLRSLVVAPDGEATATAAAPLSAVFYREDAYWRATDGMLARARTAGREGRDPLDALYSAETGVPQLRRVLGRGQQMSPRTLSEAGYAARTFGVEVTPDQALAALEHVSQPLTQALTGGLNELLDAIVTFEPSPRYLLDAALDTLDPASRRQKALWLLANGATPTTQLSARTPIQVLLANPTLDGGDAVVLRRLVATGADTGPGLLGAAAVHPFGQLVDRNLAEEELLPLVDALRDVTEQEGPQSAPVEEPRPS